MSRTGEGNRRIQQTSKMKDKYSSHQWVPDNHISDSELQSLPQKLDVEFLRKEKEEKFLQRFDLDDRYGPYKGIDRMKRWERAERFGLSPPTVVWHLLHETREKYDGMIEDRWNMPTNQTKHDYY